MAPITDALHLHPNVESKWIAWLRTTDHKNIGILYLSTAFFFFLVGGIEALVGIDLALPPGN